MKEPTTTPGNLRSSISALAFPPGESPFEARGRTYLTILAPLDRLQGGRRRLLDALPDDATREFFAQSFRSTYWYDFCPAIILSETMAKLVEQPVNDFLRERAKAHAESDFSGLFKIALKLASPEIILNAMVKVGRFYYSFGEGHIELAQRGQARVVQKLLPEPFVNWWNMTAGPYMEVAISRSGARNIVTKTTVSSVSKLVHGVPACSVTYDMRWDPDDTTST
jgi:hypothetical protein